MIHNILDTSVLMENPHIFNSLEDMIIIPIDVIKELDNNKTRSDLGGKNAREAIRIISKHMSSQSAGVQKSDNAFNLIISHKEFKNTSPDDSVIKTALLYKTKSKIVILHSNDLALRLKAIAKGLNVSEIIKPTQLDIYTGMSEIEVSSGFINDLYSTSEMMVPQEMDGKFYPNEFVVLKSGKQSAIAKYKNKKFVKIQQHKKIFGIDPRSKEQDFALELLLDSSVELVSLIGKAGTGKSLLTLAAGLHQTLETGLYEKMIVIKPIISVGKEMGFLPGGESEKLEPWVQPIKDNLLLLLGNKKQLVDKMLEDGTIEIEPLCFIRGRSIPKSFIFVDEAQNCSIHELKTIITRASEGSKIILCGDVNQIDNYSIDLFTNGLSQVIDKFKKYDISGHMTLMKGQRSNLASIASDIL